MRQSAVRYGVHAAIIGTVIACSMFGQPLEMRQEMESLRHEAEAAASRGECATAISLYKSAISVEQDSVWPHRGLADCYRVNGSWAKAAEQYDAVTEIDSTDADARQLAALTRRALAEQQEDVVKAGTYTAIKKFPLSWPALSAESQPGSAESDGPTGRNIRFVAKPVASAPQSIPVRVAFARDKYTLDEKATRQLAEVAASIGSTSERPESIVVEGHTCTCGSVEANIELGRRRAEAVRDFLIAKGVAPAARITTISYGSSRPVESAGAPNLSPAICELDSIHSENRRVVVLLYGSVANSTPPSPRLDVSFLSRRAGTRSFELLPDGGRLRSGDEYMIRLKAQEPIYAYVFHRQSDGTWVALAPASAPEARSAQLSISVAPDQEVSIPSTNAGFELDPKTGVEETIIYSRIEPDKDLESLVREIQAAQDKGFVNLLPPDLPDPPKLKATDAVPTMHGQVSEARPLQQDPGGTKLATISKPTSNEQPAIQVGDRSAPMRGLVMKDPRAKDWPQLPPNPVAFVRFDHLSKDGN